jgi:hypothetical protein
VGQSRVVPAQFVVHIRLEALAGPIDFVDIEQEYLNLDLGGALVATRTPHIGECQGIDGQGETQPQDCAAEDPC